MRRKEQPYAIPQHPDDQSVAADAGCRLWGGNQPPRKRRSRLRHRLEDAPTEGAADPASADAQAETSAGTQTVGAAWGKMNVYLDELERILLDSDLDVDVVQE
jgi:hypothetical protein